MLIRTMTDAVRRHVWMPTRVLAQILLATCVASLGAGAGRAAPLESGFTPGLYEIELRIGMPHVLRVGESRQLRRCLSAAELESGSAFFVLSENPLGACKLVDYRAAGGVARYRIVCPGANAAGAEGMFDRTAAGYRGTIWMQMGGKNMTMYETQVATRIGECDGSPGEPR